MNLQLDNLDHRNFTQAKILIERQGENYFAMAVRDVAQALEELYGANEVSLQQLSATFRRGDLFFAR